MARRMFKYPLHVGAEAKHKIILNSVAGFIPRRIDLQDGQVCLWAEIIDTGARRNQTILVVGTGHEIPVTAKEYIGSLVFDEDGLVWHYYLEH
jgi:hypothetical protein